jgi:hypothetical protein
VGEVIGGAIRCNDLPSGPEAPASLDIPCFGIDPPPPAGVKCIVCGAAFRGNCVVEINLVLNIV